LAIKILNASKFALTMGGDADLVLDSELVTAPIDRAMLAGLADVVETATAALEAYDHTRALETTETYFWTFCDDYLELVKDRAYNRDGAVPESESASARTALAIAVDAFLRLFAPVLPFATEEVWSWYRTGSVHQAPWPQAEPLRAASGVGTAAEATGEAGDVALVHATGAALAALRKVKSEAKVSQRTTFARVRLQLPAESVAAVQQALGDLRSAGRVRGDLEIVGAPSGGATEVVDSELDEAPPRR